MTACIPLLEEQRLRERRYTDFCASLHPERTVMLADLASDPAAPKALGIDTWFDQRLFRTRLGRAWEFLTSLQGDRLQRRVPLVFYQSNDPEEDQAEHERRMQYPHYADALSHAPPQIHYLLPRTNFGPDMHGDWKRGNRVIQPLTSFSSWTWRGLYEKRPTEPVKSCEALGYRVPDYPRLLEVSGRVATDYMARTVIHDLGHGWLPPVGFETEPLHDAVMVHAMGASPFAAYQSRWEELVHRESVDPTFFVNGVRLLRGVRSKGLGDGARFFRRDLLRYLKKSASAPKRRALWQLPRLTRGEKARRHVHRALEVLVEGGFNRYTT